VPDRRAGTAGEWRRDAIATVRGRLGRARLRQVVRSGLPPRLREPLAYLVGGSPLTPPEQAVVARVERVRAALAAADGTVSVLPSPEGYRPRGAGDPRPAPGRAATASLAAIATTASVHPYWGAFLHRTASAAGARTMLELGGCAGISGCYLAAAPRCERFVTVEGSPELAAIARRSLADAGCDGDVVHDLFDAALDRLLPTFADVIDLVHVDGQHERQATLHYFHRVAPHIRPGGLIVFDDIHWTPGMEAAWRQIQREPGIAWAVDVGRYGVCFWDGASRHARRLDFSAYSGFWRAGRPRERRG
jgi:predicted O-methyltransferase YrrM